MRPFFITAHLRDRRSLEGLFTEKPSGGKNLGEGDREPREQGRFERIPLAIFMWSRIMPRGKPEDLDGFRLRIHDPV
jgi:hypothetical protein